MKALALTLVVAIALAAIGAAGIIVDRGVHAAQGIIVQRGVHAASGIIVDRGGHPVAQGIIVERR